MVKTQVDEKNDIQPVKLLKAKARQVLTQKVRLDVMHNIAVFLNSGMKSLLLLSPARNKAVLKKAFQLLSEVSAKQLQTLAASVQMQTR